MENPSSLLLKFSCLDSSGICVVSFLTLFRPFSNVFVVVSVASGDALSHRGLVLDPFEFQKKVSGVALHSGNLPLCSHGSLFVTTRCLLCGRCYQTPRGHNTSQLIPLVFLLSSSPPLLHVSSSSFALSSDQSDPD